MARIVKVVNPKKRMVKADAGDEREGRVNVSRKTIRKRRQRRAGLEGVVLAITMISGPGLGGCHPHEIPTPSGQQQGALPEAAGPFRSQMDLLQSIKDGTFAKRAGIEQEVEAAVGIPEPVEIGFEHGTTVPKDQVAKLTKLADAVASRFDVDVDLLGCSDASGPADENLRISKARAEAVAAKLRELGLPGKRIRNVEARGEGCKVQQRFVRVTPVAVAPSTVATKPAGADKAPSAARS